jgi:hypothetical protein
MLSAGRAAVDAAKADGRWTAAYAPPSEAELPADLRAVIAADPAAQAMFDVLTRSRRRTCAALNRRHRRNDGRKATLSSVVSHFPAAQRSTTRRSADMLWPTSTAKVVRSPNRCVIRSARYCSLGAMSAILLI